ncbi:hypothetical protein KUCAC02_024239 [Chaenocephalus aceratus]|uniref:Uncharacterized protein n=1 Tax=Chaenocephalus aceratus TaxID=36190 RepID=A0ACB9WIY1_CHAAC|nr:hypothetical protein KUCAC02_024239 [Chaenocephalus aceratus]
MKNGKQTRSAKDILAAKHGIYSWPLDSPFQMLDHVKQSINITCAACQSSQIRERQDDVEVLYLLIEADVSMESEWHKGSP